MSTVDPKGNRNGNGELPLLPRWFATKGPRPFWLAENWSMIMAVLSAVVVFVNTVVIVNVDTPTTREWINAGIAWVASAALFLQGRAKSVSRIAAWRARVRAEEEAAKKDEPEPPV